MENIKEKKLLKVKNLNMLFKVRGTYKKVLDDVTFDINEGDFFGVIGESGSGKTTTGKAIIKLYQASGGVIEFENQLISQSKMSNSKKKWMRKNIQMIFQDPMSSMNPIKNVLKIVSEPLIINGIARDETLKYINTITTVNPYFKNNFSKQNINNFIDFKKKYFLSLIDIYKNAINELSKQFNTEISDLLTASEIVDSILNNLIGALETNLEKCYTFLKQQQDLIATTIDKYNKNDLDQFDIELFNVNKKIKEIIEIKNSSKELNDLKKRKKELLKELKLVKKNFHTLYFCELSSYKNVILARINSNIKTNNHLKVLSTNNIQFYYFLINELSQKLIYKLLIFLFDKHKFLTISKIEELVVYAEEFINNEYKDILIQLLELEKTFETANLNQRMDILSSLNEYKLLTDKMKKMLSIDLSSAIFEESNFDFHNVLIFVNDLFNRFKNDSELSEKDIIDNPKDLSISSNYFDWGSLLINWKGLFKLEKNKPKIYLKLLEELSQRLFFVIVSFLMGKLKKISKKNYVVLKEEVKKYFDKMFDKAISAIIEFNKNYESLIEDEKRIIDQQLLEYDILIFRGIKIINSHLFIFGDCDDQVVKNDPFIACGELSKIDKYINFAYELFNSYYFYSVANKNDLDKSILEFNKLINEVDQKIYNEREITASSFDFNEWINLYKQALLEKQDVINRRNKDINSFKQDYKLNHQPKIKSEINEIKILSKELKNIKKEFKKNVINFLNVFSQKEISTKKTFQEKIKTRNFIWTTRKSLNPKWKTQASIEYEYKNSLNNWFIHTMLYKANKFCGYLLYPFIKKNLIKEKVYESLRSVGLKHEHAYRYPHEFSGGQRQRIVIARALITKPKLIIADEPISALDVSIQSQVINIMKKLAVEQGVTFLFIAHDLSMVSYSCNKMIIMHNGRIVEKGDVNKIFKNPIHPYTKSLFKAIPELSRIHVNLAEFDDQLDYYETYGPLNKPVFREIDGKDHQVFGTINQLDEWVKNS